ncbi:MAG: hypothetical protein K5647_02555 [Clostridiales bacterium]|nr:hypothetical protein [Clostridiales bacterium]
MNKEKISEIISGIDEKYVAEASSFATAAAETVRPDAERADAGRTPAKPVKRTRRLVWTAVAACICVAALGIGGFAAAAEAKEYREAVAFFEENGLSAEGLSRSEVKAVWRDITENRFTYGKTAEVIMRAVPGFEIDQPTPEDLSAAWRWRSAIPSSGYGYRTYTFYVRDENGAEHLEKTELKCFLDGEQIWSAYFPGFVIRGCSRTKNGTAVWGHNENDFRQGQVALVDESGSILWNEPLDHGFGSETVASVLSDDDGTFAVISRGDYKFLCLARLGADGKEQSFRKTEIGSLVGIRAAARLGDGYIVMLSNSAAGVTSLIWKLDRDGNLTDSFTYEAEDCDYYITDMIEFGGRVCLSAYAVPKQKDGGGRHEIADILHYLFTEKTEPLTSESSGDSLTEFPRVTEFITSEELTSLLRDNYTAVLLLCDAGDGDPHAFYSVKGSLGGKLAVNGEGQLEWETESFVESIYSPFTSSFTIGGTCRVFRYTFDTSGRLLSQTDTGEIVTYRR